MAIVNSDHKVGGIICGEGEELLIVSYTLEYVSVNSCIQWNDGDKH